MSVIARGAIITGYAFTLWLLAEAAAAECIDINTAPAERLTDIVHVGNALLAEEIVVSAR